MLELYFYIFVSIGEDIVTVPRKSAVASAPLVKTLQEVLGGGVYLKKIFGQ